MRKTWIGIALVCFYAFPYVFMAMDQDFEHGLMTGYLVLIAAVSLLAYLGTRFSHFPYLMIGNLVSFIVSFFFIREMAGNDAWSGYFKPISPYSLLILVSVLAIIPQLIAIRIAKSSPKKEV